MITAAQLDSLVQAKNQALPLIKQAMEWSDIGDIAGNLGGSIGGALLTGHYMPHSTLVAPMIGMALGGVGGSMLGRRAGEQFDPTKPEQPPPLTAQELAVLRQHLHAIHPYLAKQGQFKNAGSPGLGWLTGKAPAVASTLAKGVKLSGPALGEEAARAAQGIPKSFLGKAVENPMVQMIGAQKAMELGGEAWDWTKNKVTGSKVQPQGYAQGGYAGSHYQTPVPSYAGGGGDNSLALSTAYNRYGQQQPHFNFAPGQNFFQKGSELTGERKLAFQAGVEAFCKEADFDEEDRAALNLLMEKQAIPWGNLAKTVVKGAIPSVVAGGISSMGSGEDPRFNPMFGAGKNMGAEGMANWAGDAMSVVPGGFIPGAIASIGGSTLGRAADWMASTGRYSGNYEGPQVDFKPGGAVAQKYQSMITPQARAAAAAYKPPIVAPGKKIAGWDNWWEEAGNWWDAAANTGIGGNNWSKIFNPLYWASGYGGTDIANSLFGPKAQTKDQWKQTTGVGQVTGGTPVEQAERKSILGPSPAEIATKGMTPEQKQHYGHRHDLFNAGIETGAEELRNSHFDNPENKTRMVRRIAASIPNTDFEAVSRKFKEMGLYEPPTAAVPPPAVKAPPSPAAAPITQRKNQVMAPTKTPGMPASPTPGGANEDIQIFRRPPAPDAAAAVPGAPGAASTPGSVASTPGSVAKPKIMGMADEFKQQHGGMDPNQVSAAAGVKSQAALTKMKQTMHGNKPSAVSPSATPTPSSVPGGTVKPPSATGKAPGIYVPEGFEMPKSPNMVPLNKIGSVADKGQPPGSSSLPTGAPVAPGSGNAPPGSIPGQNVMPPSDMVPGRTPSVPPASVAPSVSSPKMASPLGPTLTTGQTL